MSFSSILSVFFSSFYFERALWLFKGLLLQIAAVSLMVSVIPAVQAAKLSSIGDVSVPVIDESNEERWRASYSGLSEVLLRLTGDETSLQSDAAKNLMKDNSRYLLRFGYEPMKQHGIEPYYKDDYANDSSVMSRASNALKVLSLHFDYQLLIKDMQKSGLAVWDVNRPELMFWWITEDRGSRTVLSESEKHPARDALLHYAKFYGLPIKFPLMDMEDRKQVQTSDLWGLYVEQLAKANKRYGNKTWVIGKHYFSAGKWHAEWTLVMMGNAKSYRTSSDSMIRLQKTVMKHISGKLADEYSVLASDEGHELMLRVSKVNSLETFNNLQTYLKNLFVIEQSNLISIKADEVQFRLSLKEPREKLQKLLKLDNKLLELSSHNPLIELEQKPAIDIMTEIDLEKTDDSAISEIPPVIELPVLYYQWNGAK